MRVVVTTLLTVTPRLASEPEPLPLYISYEVDQAERAVEGIRWLEWWMDDFAHVQTEMQASIDPQTSMMHDLSGYFGINSEA
jgi:hypothetical protein